VFGICSAEIVGKAEVCALNLVTGSSLELLHDLGTLTDTGCAEGVADCKQSTVSINGDFAAELDLLGTAEFSAFTFLAEAEFFNFNDLEMEKQSCVWATLMSLADTFALSYAFAAAILVCAQSARWTPGKLAETLFKHVCAVPLM